MPWVLCQVVRGGRHRRTQLNLRRSRVIAQHVGQLDEICVRVSMRLHGQRLGGTGDAGTVLLASPPPYQWSNRHYTMPQEGSNYRMDGRLLYKCEAADRSGRSCWCQVLNKYQQDQVTAELSRGRHSQEHRHISTQEAAQKQKKTAAIDFFFEVCGVERLFWHVRGSKDDRDSTARRSKSWQAGKPWL